MLFIIELITKGKLKPVIDRTYPLEKVPEAHGYVEMDIKRECCNNQLNKDYSFKYASSNIIS
jgi:hypothetical protein